MMTIFGKYIASLNIRTALIVVDISIHLVPLFSIHLVPLFLKK